MYFFPPVYPHFFGVSPFLHNQPEIRFESNHRVKLEENQDNTRKQLPCKESQEKDFYTFFKEQLINKQSTTRTKQWTAEEDSLLLKLASEGVEWKRISLNLSGKSADVCQRRFKKLAKKDRDWPKEKQESIKHLYEMEKKSWNEIHQLFPEHTAKQIRQRYKNFLQMDARRQVWSVEEDLHLWEQVILHGKHWKKISKSFDRRTQLQLKNRFYKTLKPLGKKIKRKMRLKSESEQERKK